MPARDETASPATRASACARRTAVAALAGDGAVVDAAALARRPPDAVTLVTALREQRRRRRGRSLRGRARAPCRLRRRRRGARRARRRARRTVVLAVPNDAPSDAAGGPAPQRLGRGRGRGAARPAARRPRRLRPVALRGAALVPAATAGRAVASGRDRARAPPCRGFVLAFGPRAPRLAPRAAVGAADLSAERACERARTAELECCARGSPRSTPGRSSRRPTAASRPRARVKVAFLVNDLQLCGGVGVVVEHARQLADRHGFDVTLVLAREQEDPHWTTSRSTTSPSSRSPRRARERFDIAVVDLVGDGVLAVRAARRALRVLRPDPRGPLLPPGRGRPDRRRG